MGVSHEDSRYASVSCDLFSHMLSHMYERVHDPKRSGHIKMKEFENGTKMHMLSHITVLSDVMKYLEENSPTAGLNIELYRGRTANGMIWHVTKSDVHGPMYYPHVMPPEIDCDAFRQRLLDGAHLRHEAKDLGINLPEARKHARGNCECDNDVGSLDFDNSERWVKIYVEDNSISNCHGSTD